METTFKKGDRVRLKAWVTKQKFGKRMKHIFLQGCVGIVSFTSPGAVWTKGVPYVALQIPTLPKKYNFLVAIEDLELMPEQQVHVVKDGKVYEMRKSEPTKLPCIKCSLSEFGKTCPKTCQIHYNYQEVKSGKLVS